MDDNKRKIEDIVDKESRKSQYGPNKMFLIGKAVELALKDTVKEAGNVENMVKGQT
jgi:hypothetical protein